MSLLLHLHMSARICPFQQTLYLSKVFDMKKDREGLLFKKMAF